MNPYEIRHQLQTIRDFVMAYPKGGTRHQVDQILPDIAKSACMRIRETTGREVSWSQAVHAYAALRALRRVAPAAVSEQVVLVEVFVAETAS